MYSLSKLAESDLEKIWIYTYKNWSQNQADIYYSQLIHTFIFLSEDPEIGQDISSIRDSYRKYPVNKHMIFYKQDANTVHIVRILHQSMDVPAHI